MRAATASPKVVMELMGQGCTVAESGFEPPSCHLEKLQDLRGIELFDTAAAAF